MTLELHRMAAWLAVTTALCVPGVAAAQQDEPDPNVAVQDRPRPDYDPLGIRAGSFFIYPSLTVQGAYDDNIFATDGDEEDDFIAVISPQIEAQSDWNRHALSVGVGAEGGLYQDTSDNNYFDFTANADGRLDITRADTLRLGVELSRLHQDRESPDDRQGDDADAANDEEITKYWLGQSRLDYRHNFNRLFTVVGGDVSRFDFEDADDINNDDRDRNQYRGRVRVGYQVSPRLAGFVEGVYDVRRYDQTPDDEGLDRDSEGFAVRAGTEIDFTGILFGEVAVGYTHRMYDDDELDSVDGISALGTLTWNVTQLTSIVFTGQADVEETTVTAEDDRATADFQKTIAIDVTHELLRNVLLNGNAAYIRDDFEGTDRTDNTVTAGAGVSYLLNRNLSLDASYSFSTRDSDEDDEEYTRNIFRVGVTARL